MCLVSLSLSLFLPSFLSDHGNPAVEVAFTKIGTTMAMCGPSGTSFANLLVEQFQTAQDKSKRDHNKRDPLQDFVWETDEL